MSVDDVIPCTTGHRVAAIELVYGSGEGGPIAKVKYAAVAAWRVTEEDKLLPVTTLPGWFEEVPYSVVVEPGQELPTSEIAERTREAFELEVFELFADRKEHKRAEAFDIGYTDEDGQAAERVVDRLLRIGWLTAGPFGGDSLILTSDGQAALRRKRSTGAAPQCEKPVF